MMQVFEITRVTSPNEARSLLRTMNADALVVGTVTAYDTYDPPKIWIGD